MILGCHSYSLCDQSRADAFARLGALGLGSIELWCGHANYRDPDLRTNEVLEEARRHGLTVEAYCVGGLFGLPLEEVESRLRRAFAVATSLQTDLVTGIVDLRALKLVEQLCVRQRMRFAIENHWYTEFARPADFSVLGDVRPCVGIALDTGHFSFLGYSPAAVVSQLGHRTFDVHLKLVHPAGPLRRLRRRWQGHHSLPAAETGPKDGLGPLVESLWAVGFEGLLAIEHESEMSSPAAIDRLRTRVCHVGKDFLEESIHES